MATNAKRKNPEHSDNPENSELEVMRARIRKLEKTVKAKTEELLMKDVKEKELMSKVKELQMFKNDHVDHHHEAQENEVVDTLLAFMNNNGFKQIAYKIFSFLDCNSFVQCRQVCRSWKNFIDNEWSMLQLQIFHLKRQPDKIDEVDKDGKPYHHLLNEWQLNLGPLIKIMEKTTNKSKLRAFINMCQELVSNHCCLKLQEDPLRYMIDHHRHQELELLIDYPIPKNLSKSYYGWNGPHSLTRIFKHACQYGCKICVKLFLDRSEEMKIGLNLVKKREIYHDDHNLHYEHCLHVANNHRGDFRKEVIDLLLRSAEEKGIDINAKNVHGRTLRDEIIRGSIIDDIEDYSEATYKILNIDPSVDLKRR